MERGRIIWWKGSKTEILNNHLFSLNFSVFIYFDGLHKIVILINLDYLEAMVIPYLSQSSFWFYLHLLLTILNKYVFLNKRGFKLLFS